MHIIQQMYIFSQVSIVGSLFKAKNVLSYFERVADVLAQTFCMTIGKP